MTVWVIAAAWTFFEFRHAEETNEPLVFLTWFQSQNIVRIVLDQMLGDSNRFLHYVEVALYGEIDFNQELVAFID